MINYRNYPNYKMSREQLIPLLLVRNWIVKKCYLGKSIAVTYGKEISETILLVKNKISLLTQNVHALRCAC